MDFRPRSITGDRERRFTTATVQPSSRQTHTRPAAKLGGQTRQNNRKRLMGRAGGLLIPLLVTQKTQNTSIGNRREVSLQTFTGKGQLYASKVNNSAQVGKCQFSKDNNHQT